MAEQGKSVRMTRLAKKRAAMAEEERPAKKRVVLGEITNSSNVVVNAGGSEEPPQKQPKSKTKGKGVKKASTTATKLEETKDNDNEDKSDDPQMCGPYVSEIYDYLHNMEVKKVHHCFFDWFFFFFQLVLLSIGCSSILRETNVCNLWIIYRSISLRLENILEFWDWNAIIY